MEKYTIIIPTRDRAETLGATIQTCLRQTYPNLSIIVSDNCSHDNTREVFKIFDDNRLTYIKTSSTLSMSDHFEFALNYVSDGFLMFLGSDDGLMPDAVNYVDSIVARYKVRAVTGTQATYIWPNFPDKEVAGRLTLGTYKSGVEIRKSSEWIQKTISFKSSRYCFDLPSAYCGFVHKDLVKMAISNGRYFESITPDAYSAFATALFTDTFAYSNKPFVIAGASHKSNGASTMHPAASPEESNKYILENDGKFMDGFIYCPSMEIICAEAFAQLSCRFPDKCKTYNIDIKAMLLLALRQTNDRTKQEVYKAVNKMAEVFCININNEDNSFIGKIKYLINNMENALRIIFSKSKIIEIPDTLSMGVENIDDAALIARFVSITNLSDHIVTSKKRILNKLNIFKVEI